MSQHTSPERSSLCLSGWTWIHRALYLPLLGLNVCGTTLGLSGTLNRQNYNLLLLWLRQFSNSKKYSKEPEEEMASHQCGFLCYVGTVLFICICMCVWKLSTEPRPLHMLLEVLHFIPKCATVKSGQSFSDTVCHTYRKQEFSDLKRLLQT